ncbi:general control transcription factor Gcn4p [[Candida] railenensis]|uniref:General control transcription factor Gcn4p n=1 Tax=[Candida] railenensis TaxID=45579 RepID=A0A9P0VWH0_9ASCO|nr:general control transcription factor Gcn4p [[Candida] railenensis]
MSSSDPMIFSADSMMFESADSLLPTSTLAFSDTLPVSNKHEQVEELSSHLPEYFGDADTTSAPSNVRNNLGEASPFEIHSAVLDSVFSTTADDAQTFEETPMFDELDFIVDGVKPNSKDDWVSLFNDDEKHFITPKPKDSSKRLFSEIEETFEFAAVKSIAPHVTAEQLVTPAHSTFTSPDLDHLHKKVPSTVSSDKVDHLGCVTYSKKQRTQPLSPVPSDGSDPVLLKRARNTEAARRSRARKMERMSQLEDRVEGLLSDKSELESEVARLKELLSVNGISF